MITVLETICVLTNELWLVNWITMTRKSGKLLHITYGSTGQLVWPYLVSSVVYNVISTTGDRTSNHRFQSWNSTQVTPYYLVMVIARLINLNVSCKLHLYSLQRTRSPPRPRLSEGIRNMHLRNYYNLCAIWTDGSVVEFWLCNLRLLVQSLVVEITIYTADES